MSETRTITLSAQQWRWLEASTHSLVETFGLDEAQARTCGMDRTAEQSRLDAAFAQSILDAVKGGTT